MNDLDNVEVSNIVFDIGEEEEENSDRLPETQVVC